MEDRGIGQGMNVAGKKVEHERVLTAHVSDKSLGGGQMWVLGLTQEKNSRVSHGKVKKVYSGR